MSESEGFYCPTAIYWWNGYISRGLHDENHSKHHHSLIRNIGYSLQYIEFLNYQYFETPLHSTVRVLTRKAFVINCMSVIESLAFYLLSINNRHKVICWEEIEEWSSNEKDHIDGRYRIISKLEKKLDAPIPVDMNLDGMLKRLEKYKLIQISNADFATLSYLRGLRNKVHVYDVSHNSDTDWNSFKEVDRQNTKRILSLFLTSEQFTPSDEDYETLEWLMDGR